MPLIRYDRATWVARDSRSAGHVQARHALGIANAPLRHGRSAVARDGRCLVRADEGAANKAISSPLLEEASIEGARGILINITGGEDLTLYEVPEAAEIVHSHAHPEAQIILGTVIDKKMSDCVKITVIATGFDQLARGQALGAAAARQVNPRPAAAPTPQGMRPVAQAPSSAPAGSFFRPPQLATPQTGYEAAFKANPRDLDVPTFLRNQMD